MRFVWPLFVLLASSTGLLAQSRYEIVDETLVLKSVGSKQPGF